MVSRGTGHPRKRTVPLRTGRVRRGARISGDRGQSTVEFVALLPIFVLVALATGQCAVAGYAAWSASGAARIAARAQALGNDPRPAMRAELPGMLLRKARVSATTSGDHAGRVTVRLHVPSVVPGLSFGTVQGSAQLPDQAGA